MAGLVLVEGLPGSGKTTTSRLIHDWARAEGLPVRHFGEGHTDHPVDFEEVAVLSGEDLRRLIRDFPAQAGSLDEAALPRDGYWLVPERERASWPEELRNRLRARDAYDGDVTPDLHRTALLDSWRRFAAAAAADPTSYVFECVLVQNPVCALLARFDQPEAAVTAHVRDLVSAVADLEPLLIYLDAGEPERVLTAAAEERPASWLDFVIRYHTEQGYGRARGLSGFEGLVDFMRMRRELELSLVRDLPIRSVVLDVSGDDREAGLLVLRSTLVDHLVGPRSSSAGDREPMVPVGQAAKKCPPTSQQSGGGRR